MSETSATTRGSRKERLRWRTATLAGVASFGFALGEVSLVKADWFSRPKPTTLKPAPVPTSENGFAPTIRRLMTDAKANADQGKFEKAVTLAERANRLSEAAGAMIPPTSDCSPNATSRLLNELVAHRDADASRQRIPTASQTNRETVAAASARPVETKAISSVNREVTQLSAQRFADRPNDASTSEKIPDRSESKFATRTPTQSSTGSQPAELDWDDELPPNPAALPTTRSQGSKYARALPRQSEGSESERVEKPKPFENQSDSTLIANRVHEESRDGSVDDPWQDTVEAIPPQKDAAFPARQKVEEVAVVTSVTAIDATPLSTDPNDIQTISGEQIDTNATPRRTLKAKTAGRQIDDVEERPLVRDAGTSGSVMDRQSLSSSNRPARNQGDLNSSTRAGLDGDSLNDTRRNWDESDDEDLSLADDDLPRVSKRVNLVPESSLSARQAEVAERSPVKARVSSDKVSAATNWAQDDVDDLAESTTKPTVPRGKATPSESIEPGSSFPVQRVVQLRKRLENVTALNPGMAFTLETQEKNRSEKAKFSASEIDKVGSDDSVPSQTHAEIKREEVQAGSITIPAEKQSSPIFDSWMSDKSSSEQLVRKPEQAAVASAKGPLPIRLREHRLRATNLNVDGIPSVTASSWNKTKQHSVGFSEPMLWKSASDQSGNGASMTVPEAGSSSSDIRDHQASSTANGPSITPISAVQEPEIDSSKILALPSSNQLDFGPRLSLPAELELAPPPPLEQATKSSFKSKRTTKSKKDAAAEMASSHESANSPTSVETKGASTNKTLASIAAALKLTVPATVAVLSLAVLGVLLLLARRALTQRRI